MENNFDEIRCYNDSEIHDVLSKLIEEKPFIKVLSTVYPLLPKEIIKQKILSYQRTYDFQKGLVFPFLQSLEASQTKGIRLKGLENIEKADAYLYISNHRDIILDSALLCSKFIEQGMDTVEIAIGDNLLIYPWIEELVRVNKSFIVKRGLSPRQILESSQRLSAYIKHTIREKKQSIWIAQREGRAKDSNDKTQESILKMFNMSGKGSFVENMLDLNICPLSISYEYDPCDFLKAKELQQRRDDPEFKKSPYDDLESMQTGVMGYKGKVVYHLTGTIEHELRNIERQTSNKNEQISLAAQIIDKKIHSGYVIFPGNKIAYDLLRSGNEFSAEYTTEDKKEFERYLSHQLSKIEIDNKDEDFLREKMLEMYANPFINYLKAKE